MSYSMSTILMWGLGIFFLGLLGYGFYIVLSSKDENYKLEKSSKKSPKKSR